jgi:hypothetical protein
MDTGQRIAMAAQLRHMVPDVPSNAFLHCVVGIWKLPDEDNA